MSYRGGSTDGLGGEGHHGRPLLRFGADLDDLIAQFLEMIVVKRGPNEALRTTAQARSLAGGVRMAPGDRSVMRAFVTPCTRHAGKMRFFLRTAGIMLRTQGAITLGLLSKASDRHASAVRKEVLRCIGTRSNND